CTYFDHVNSVSLVILPSPRRPNSFPTRRSSDLMKAGGRLLGQLYEEPGGGWWNGIEESKKLFEYAVNNGAEILLSTPVNNIENRDRKSTRLNSSHVSISYAVFCLKKKNSDSDIK